ncbi:hypothetical protein M9Y10_024148 [Tritrichomonas musculus]|uniref:Tectonic domain-containing protein n=1 Tax=Tritrichomonas musculus TaxID=1915356 RepID=A0ABR2KXA3_9EUKA
MILCFILPLISFSINEAYFENQKNQCICAIKPNECNPYCDCDPFCTPEQKEEFKNYFYLPESDGKYKMSCDPNNRIDKTNLKSIKEVDLNNIKCFSIEGSEFGKKIYNYDSADFGFGNLDEAVESSFVPIKFKNFNNVSYMPGQILVGNGSISNIAPFYFPVAIGSSASNAFIPIRFNASFPKYTGRLLKDRFFFSEVVITTIRGHNGTTKNSTTFIGYDQMRRDIIKRQAFLDIQYIFRCDENYTTILNASMKKLPAPELVQDIPDSNYFYSSFQVFFSKDANERDNTYLPLQMGYYYGTPIMAVNKTSIPNPTKFEVADRIPIKKNADDILFGVNATIILSLDQDDDKSINIDDVYDVTYLTDLKISTPSAIKDIIYKLFPPYNYIFKTYGMIFPEGGGTSLYVNRTSTFDESNTNINSGLKFPIAYWTFYYKKFNNHSAPAFLLQRFIPSLAIPNVTDFGKQGMIKVAFIELDDDGNLFLEDEVRFQSGKFSTLFDFFFMDKSDALKTIGIFFCFAIIATIWCWYACFFYIED